MVVAHREGPDALGREGAHLAILGHVGEQIETAVGLRDALWLDEIRLHAARGSGEVTHVRTAPRERRVDSPRDDVAGETTRALLTRSRLGLHEPRQRVEEPAGGCRQRTFDLHERAIEFLAE